MEIYPSLDRYHSCEELTGKRMLWMLEEEVQEGTIYKNEKNMRTYEKTLTVSRRSGECLQTVSNYEQVYQRLLDRVMLPYLVDTRDWYGLVREENQPIGKCKEIE